MNEAEPTTRLRLHVSTAVQGELFPATGTQPVTRGYKGTVASKVAGITYRQLDYWARRQIVEPSITPSHGSGSRRLYSFKDVVILAGSTPCTMRRAVFGVSVGSLWKQIRETLAHEEYVDLTTMPSMMGGNRPVDDITAMRMRKNFEAQHQTRAAASL